MDILPIGKGHSEIPHKIKKGVHVISSAGGRRRSSTTAAAVAAYFDDDEETCRNSDHEEELAVLLEELRQLVQGENKCELRIDDQFLVKFLRARNYDVKRAYESVKNYHKCILKYDDILKEVRPNELKPLFDTKFGLILKERCKLGSKIIFYQIKHWNVKLHSLQELIQLAMFCTETIIQDKETQLNGATAILDLNGLSLSHLKTLTLKEIKRGIYSFQGGFPVKLAGIHFINSPSIFWSIYYIASKLIKEKLYRRVHFHSNFQSLHEYFDPQNLPSTLGGFLTEDEAMDLKLHSELMELNRPYKDFYMPNVQTTTKNSLLANESCN